MTIFTCGISFLLLRKLHAVYARSSSALMTQNLNASNINTFLRTNPKALLKFWAPWCVHCIRFQDEFLRIVETSNSLSQNISFASIDITNNARISSQFDVYGIPSLFFVLNGKVWRIEGSLSHDSVIHFVEHAKTYPSIDTWQSPLGPLGTLRGYFGATKEFLFNILPHCVQYFKISRWTAFFGLIVGVAVTVLVATVIFVLVTQA